jgi:hypothetical protein
MQQLQTSLFLVQFPAGVNVQQVDDFPPQTPRSCEGALHIRPQSTKKITPAEAKFLRDEKGIRWNLIKKVVPKPSGTSTPRPVAQQAQQTLEEQARPRGKKGKNKPHQS